MLVLLCVLNWTKYTSFNTVVTCCFGRADALWCKFRVPVPCAIGCVSTPPLTTNCMTNPLIARLLFVCLFVFWFGFRKRLLAQWLRFLGGSFPFSQCPSTHLENVNKSWGDRAHVMMWQYTWMGLKLVVFSPVLFKPSLQPRGFSLMFSAKQHLRFNKWTIKPEYVEAWHNMQAYFKGGMSNTKLRSHFHNTGALQVVVEVLW